MSAAVEKLIKLSEYGAMSLGKTRVIGAALLVLSLIVLIGGGWSMASRLADRELPNVFFRGGLPHENFQYLGSAARLKLIDNNTPTELQPALPVRPSSLPAVDPDDERPAVAVPDDSTPVLRLTYRGSYADFPIHDEASARLFPPANPEDGRLELMKAWFGVFPMVTGAQTAEEATRRVNTGELRERLIVAARYEPAGFEGDWGKVRRQDWLYRIVELHPEGTTLDDGTPAPGLTIRELTYRELDTLHTPGRRVPVEQLPSPEDRARDIWMHYTMLQVTPAQFYRAKDRRLDDALQAMGWTWPVTLGGGFGAVLSIIVIGFGFKQREILA